MKSGLSLCCAILAAGSLWAEQSPSQADLPALKPSGENFVDPAGKPVRFWGVNLVALYPEHAAADALAANLASLGVNLVRPHHNLRPSLDWNPGMLSGSLLKYQGNSREFDPSALDRFDYLNAALRKQNIYLALSVNWTRRYRADDAAILPGDEADAAAWKAALAELDGWNWKKAFDIYKMLPVIDERAALLNEEFIRAFLKHVNPYTGREYATDPQVLTFEVMNEASTEYAIICGNRFPAYWQARLEAKWAAFAQQAGIEPGDLYKPASPQAKEVRARFLRQLDEEYEKRITKVIRETGSQAPVAFSNLWRGDNYAQMNAGTAGFIEDHMYMDPMVAGALDDGFYKLSRSALADKPFFVGEFNQAEGADNIAKQSPVRSMLPVAAAAYASLQNWTGIVWFAWIHGDQLLGADGWAKTEGRQSALGNMAGDGMMIDHLRTTGMIFRRGLVAKSAEPFTLWVDNPVAVGDYNGLMRGKYNYKPGWQSVHGVRKAFGPVPAGQPAAPWMTQSPASPVVSDTKEIVKDIARRQLTIAAPQAEAFSGYGDDQPAAALKHLAVTGGTFATAVVVADDGKALGESAKLVVSRTGIAADNSESPGPALRLAGLRKPADGEGWFLTPTRPRSPQGAEQKLDPASDGSLTLPAGEWHEGELTLRSTGTDH